jgi:ACS family hexuronate transporter-like MFS transporter
MADTHHSPLTTHHSSWRWWVCGVLLLATFLNYMDRQALAVTLPELKERYNLQERRIGMVEGCFGYAFAVGAVVFGLLADRYGPRALYPIVLTGWSIAGIATGFAGYPEVVGWLELPDDEPGAGTYRWLLFWRTVLGLCEAGHWPCALITARRILSAKDRALGNGILQSGASFASILIPLYAQAVEHFGGGWQITFWSIGVVGLLWVPVWLALVRAGDLDPRAGTGDGPNPPEDDDHPVSLTRRILAMVIIISTLAVSWQFLRAWLPLYLQDFHGYEQWDARLAVSGYYIAAEVGCLLVGFVVMGLVNRGRDVHSARVITFAGYTVLTAAAAAVPLLGSGPLMIAGLMLAGAGILGLHPLYYSLGQELPHRRMGMLTGVIAGVGWVVASTFQIVIGARIQETKSYDLGLVIVGLAPVLGLVALLTLWRPSAAKSSGARPADAQQ